MWLDSVHRVAFRKKRQTQWTDSSLWGTSRNLIYCQLTQNLNYWFVYWEREDKKQHRKTTKIVNIYGNTFPPLPHAQPKPRAPFAVAPFCRGAMGSLPGGFWDVVGGPCCTSSGWNQWCPAQAGHGHPQTEQPNPVVCAWFSVYFLLICIKYSRSFTWCSMRFYVL